MSKVKDEMRTEYRREDLGKGIRGKCFERASATQETLYLLAVPGMRESIKAGMAEPLAESAKALEW